VGSCCPEGGGWLGCQWGEARLGSHLGSTENASGMMVVLDQETDQLAMNAVESCTKCTIMVHVALWLSQTNHPAFSALCVFGCMHVRAVTLLLGFRSLLCDDLYSR
jgi:hypothetical protein